MNRSDIIDWLLEGDVSIQYQVHRDLLGQERPDLQARILTEGWGEQFLAARKPNGHWGRGFYAVKWISTHYSLLDIKNLGVAPGHPTLLESVNLVAANHKSEDGGINPAGTIKEADVCINGMFLDYACAFGIDPALLESVIDFIISQQLPDGGFNCRFNRSGAVHSSMHSTISLLEGMHAYLKRGYAYRKSDLEAIIPAAEEFLLMHQLFLSDRTGEIIDKKWLMLSYPSRWKFDILRGLVYFQTARRPYDRRMQAAIDVLLKKRLKDGRWPVQAKHTGLVHFDMEKTGKPSRWNTLRALRVLDHFGIDA